MNNLLLTNDDGIDAPGLAALVDIVRSTANVYVVAPRDAHSGCGHQVTHHRPLLADAHDVQKWAVDGTPADCVRLGLGHLAPDVDWVLSGINDGANLGIDVYMSGTVAAAREAALCGKPAIALSQYREGNLTGWAHLPSWIEQVLSELQSRRLPAGFFWNVNFPDPPNLAAGEIPPIVHCPLDINALPSTYEERDGQFHYSGNYQSRTRHDESDVALCFGGKITVTAIGLATVGV